MSGVCWAVAYGDYSDYGINRVFLDKELAERWCEALGGRHYVQEFPLVDVEPTREEFEVIAFRRNDANPEWRRVDNPWGKDYPKWVGDNPPVVQSPAPGSVHYPITNQMEFYGSDPGAVRAAADAWEAEVNGL